MFNVLESVIYFQKNGNEEAFAQFYESFQRNATRRGNFDIDMDSVEKNPPSDSVISGIFNYEYQLKRYKSIFSKQILERMLHGCQILRFFN